MHRFYSLVLMFFFTAILSFSLYAAPPKTSDDEYADEEEVDEGDDYEEYQISESDFVSLIDTLFTRMQRTQVDSVRLAYNDTIVHLMELELKKPESFNRSFKNLRYIGKISSPDKQINIYTWNILLRSGFQFNGMVQTADGEVMRLTQPERPYLPDSRRVVMPNQWYGALYYEIVPYKYEGEVVYLLAGWGRYRYGTQFKVLDVLRLNDGTCEIGVPLFDNDDEMLHRIVLESDREASVTLIYDARKKRFVFDHLSPMRRSGDEVESFGPDMSFDSYVKRRNRWELKEDVKVKAPKKK